MSRRSGEQHPAAKLTQEQADEIRTARGISQVALAKKFGVSKATVSLIRAGKIWPATYDRDGQGPREPVAPETVAAMTASEGTTPTGSRVDQRKVVFPTAPEEDVL